MKVVRYIIVSLAMILVLAACKKDEKEIGTPFSKIEGLTATDWIIEEVYLVDESNPARPERSVSEHYTEGPDRLTMSFNSDGTFTVIPGEGLNFFPESGTWAFDSNDAPTKIFFTSEDDVVYESPLAGPTRIVDTQLKIRFINKYCQVDGQSKAVLGYRLVFNRKQ